MHLDISLTQQIKSKQIKSKQKMSSKYEAMCLTCSLSVESGPNFKSVGQKGVPATWEDLKDVQAKFLSDSKIWSLHSLSLIHI